MAQALFSFPFSPYISQEEYYEYYLPFIVKHKHLISDIYVTLRIPPFIHDAMGGEFDNKSLIQKALILKEDTNLPISLTFNNTTIPPTKENLDIFINCLKPLYNAGFTSITQPLFHWMLTGELQKTFPQMTFKNSVISCVNNGKSYWDCALAGYDVVNIDRNLLRDRIALEEIKKAQTLFQSQHGKAPLTQILANEQCNGYCPVRNEHYALNFSGSHYFGNEISSFSCPAWEKKDPAYEYKRANLSPFKEDIDTLLTLVDRLKLFGRDGKTMLKASMWLVSEYEKGSPLIPTFSRALEWNEYKSEKFTTWRKTITTCRFQCWNCHVCDTLVKK